MDGAAAYGRSGYTRARPRRRPGKPGRRRGAQPAERGRPREFGGARSGPARSRPRPATPRRHCAGRCGSPARLPPRLVGRGGKGGKKTPKDQSRRRLRAVRSGRGPDKQPPVPASLRGSLTVEAGICHRQSASGFGALRRAAHSSPDAGPATPPGAFFLEATKAIGKDGPDGGGRAGPGGIISKHAETPYRALVRAPVVRTPARAGRQYSNGAAPARPPCLAAGRGQTIPRRAFF